MRRVVLRVSTPRNRGFAPTIEDNHSSADQSGVYQCHNELHRDQSAQSAILSCHAPASIATSSTFRSSLVRLAPPPAVLTAPPSPSPGR